MLPQPTQTLLVTASATVTSSIEGEPWLSTSLTWRLINDADGTITIAESGDSIVQVDNGLQAPSVRYDRQFTAPTTAGKYLAIWRHSLEELAQVVIVNAQQSAAFASPLDVVTVLGRPLTTQEDSDVPGLLDMAATVIADAVDRDDGWIVSLDPVPQRLRWFSAELVKRHLTNRTGATSIRQQVGSYSYAATWGDRVGMDLSDAEVAMLRRAIYGRTTDSVHVDPGFIQAQDEYWLRKQQPVRSTDPGVTIP